MFQGFQNFNSCPSSLSLASFIKFCLQARILNEGNDDLENLDEAGNRTPKAPTAA